MFEEAQLYSPVTTDENGDVTVHLIDGHPGLEDPEYQRRRNAIAAAALAWEPGRPTPRIDYTETEEGIDRTGIIAVQIHGGPPSDAWYKDIVIEELTTE